MNARYIYVSGPYTKGDVAILAAERLRIFGFIPYVPYLSHFWHLVFPHEHEYWMRLDLQWVKMCEALLRLPGESTGADREVKEAKSLGLKVYHSIDVLIDEERGS